MNVPKEMAAPRRPASETEITIRGQTFQLGERVRLQPTRSVVTAYESGIYQITWISGHGTYLSLRWSPRPHREGRWWLGVALAYLAEQGFEILKLGARYPKEQPGRNPDVC